MFLISILLLLHSLQSTGTVSAQLDLNSGWSVRAYWIGKAPRYLLFFETRAEPMYRHPEEDGPDWIEMGSKWIFSRKKYYRPLSGMLVDIDDCLAVLEIFGASGAEKDAALIEYVDYLKEHRVPAEPAWDFDTKRIWIEDKDGSVIQLWPPD